MNVAKVMAELQALYPGKNLVQNPHELLVELEPTAKHPEASLALAVVGASQAHYHNTSTEIYEVLKGELTVYLNGKEFMLKPGEKLTINPGVEHSAHGEEAWFFVHSSPGWTFEDHILVLKPQRL